ncbi:MAG: serine/threonine-protein phosphatase [Chloroflexi bacterium]|nr:serine/threonine-protein phosphatase [Chloroflexota bacterium]
MGLPFVRFLRAPGPIIVLVYPAEATVNMLTVGSLTHPGRVRQNNEDSLCALLAGESPPGTDALLAVADGMGGHSAGEVASKLVIQCLIDELMRCPIPATPEAVPDSLTAVLAQAVSSVNAFVYRASRAPGWEGMGSTLTAMLLVGPLAAVAHVGDTRAYLHRNGNLRRLTRDHTWVAEQVAAGLLMPAQAACHPRRNVLTRALGTNPTVAVETAVVPLEAGDRLLLCSDGLHGVIEDGEIQDIISEMDPQTACEALVRRANEEGGGDNISAIVAAVHGLVEVPG